MRSQRIYWRACCCLAVLFSCCNAAAAEPETTTTVSQLLGELRTLTGVPAYSVAIVQDGNLLTAVAVGEIDTRNHIQARPENWFRLASVSKVVGATMLALLVQDGKLDPSAPISNYLQDLPEQYRDISALQLLLHTSGLPHYQPRDATIAKTHYDDATSAVASVGDRALIAAPGDTYLYSTHGYTLLSALYEAITDVPLRDSVPQFIGTLTGRPSPALENLLQRNPRRSNVFEVAAGAAQTLKPRDQSYSPFGTGFVASAADLAYFGDAVLHSTRISAATRELMFRPITLNNGAATGNYLYELGFGWRTGTDGSGRRVLHHAGVTEGARSVLVLYPESGLSVAFLSNARWTAQIERTAFSLAALVLDEQATLKSNIARDFTGTFDGEFIAGTMSCDSASGMCRFSDSAGAFSDWLNRYLPAGNEAADWPALRARGTTGDVIKIVSSVGFIELRCRTSDSFCESYAAEIGNGRQLDVKFQEAPSR